MMTQENNEGPRVLIIEGMSPFDEVFEFTAPGEPTIYVNATRLRKHCENTPGAAVCGPAVFHQQLYDHVLANNGIEKTKLARLSQRPDIYCQPVLLLECDDGSHIMADGNHRFVILWRMGIRRIPAYVIPETTWRQFVIELPF
jgi:hypothetical protein